MVKIMHFYSLVWTLVCFSFASSNKIVHVNEGENAVIVFSYKNLTDRYIVLRIANGQTFHLHKGPNTTIRNRFLVQIELDDEKNNLIQLRINHITREDSGPIRCKIYDKRAGRRIHESTMKKTLIVEYPTGRASCKIDRKFTMEGGWVLLHCAASVGSQMSHFGCYEDGTQMPVWLLPIENGMTRMQTWMRGTMPVFCCTRTFEAPVDRCGCRDYGWDPIKGRLIHVEPCPVTGVRSSSDPLIVKTESNMKNNSSKSQTDTKESSGDNQTESQGENKMLTIWLPIALFCIFLCIIYYLIIGPMKCDPKVVTSDKDKKDDQ